MNSWPRSLWFNHLCEHEQPRAHQHPPSINVLNLTGIALVPPMWTLRQFVTQGAQNYDALRLWALSAVRFSRIYNSAGTTGRRTIDSNRCCSLCRHHRRRSHCNFVAVAMAIAARPQSSNRRP
jgi:hypothetical protein